MKKFLLALLVLYLSTLAQTTCFADDSATTRQEEELRIIRITPEGEDVPVGRQIVIEFDRAVVPLGRMERTSAEIPINISPALDCKWRWLNTNSLACNLDEKSEIKLASAYQIIVNPGIRTIDGATITSPYSHRFITERPDARYTWFRTWESPSSPVIRLTFNQSVTKTSVAKHLHFSLSDSPQTRIPATVTPDPDDSEIPQVVPFPGEKYSLSFDEQTRHSDEDLRNADGEEARRIWIVRPRKELPLDIAVSLISEPGLVSAWGGEKSVTNRELVRFFTFPEFKFVGIKCSTNSGLQIMLNANPSIQSAQLCNPQQPIALSFSSPVLPSQVKKHCSFSPDLAGGRTDYDPWGSLEDEYSSLSQPHQQGQTYEIHLPTGLKAAQRYSVSSTTQEVGFLERLLQQMPTAASETDSPVTTKLQDEFGRTLSSPFAIDFETAHRNPNFEIVHRDAVLEKDIDSDVPLYVNNLDRIQFRYRAVTPNRVIQNQVTVQDIPPVDDIQFAIPFKVREMLHGQSGAIYGSLNTEPPVYKSDIRLPHRLFAQVTPYQLHVKLGHFNTLVWVTDLQRGDVVPGARVTLYRDALSTLSAPKDVLAVGTTNSEGIATLKGSEDIDPQLALAPSWDYSANSDAKTRLFLRVDRGNDMALMPLSQDFLIDTWRASGETIYEVNEQKFGHLRAWGTTAQGIYRLGDTIQYKFYLRNQDLKTLTRAPRASYTLEILDPTSKVVEMLKDITLSEFGSYDGEFAVPKTGVVGWYQFRLTSDFAKKTNADQMEDLNANCSGESEECNISWLPMRVLVSDFTPSAFKVTNELSGDLFTSQQEIKVSTTATLHSGGAYTDASVRITAVLEALPFFSRHPLASGFLFTNESESRTSQQVFQKIDQLDNRGEASHSFTLAKPNILYGKLLVESAVQDDRGKNISTRSQAEFVGVNRFVGMRSSRWLFTAQEPASVDYIVVDERGNPVAGTNVDIKIERKVTNAARVKGAGNAYTTSFTTEWKEEANCSGLSEDAPLACGFTPAEAGSYRLTASIKDTKSNSQSCRLDIWVAGKDYVLWDEPSDSHLQIVPEKTIYRVGDTARYLIKNPYPGAQALITIERYGVIDHFVKRLDGNTPVVEFPIQSDYLPGFYLSVLVVSPRVEKPPAMGQVDLGKPAFRLGYLSVPVKDSHKELQVTATADKEVYRPRETLRVSLHVEPKVPSGKTETTELAVTVLDEAVFDLLASGKSNFDPYEGFYKLDNLDLRNYSLLTRLVGRQKFEKKGANAGGDGGANLSLRHLFKFVSYWNPSIMPDKNGNATIKFQAPDNLTGWRVLAIASTATDKMGLGDTNFKVNRPTEVRPAMPNQVLEGDQFSASFSVMNRSDHKRTLDVSIEATGDIDSTKVSSKHDEILELEPYQRHTVVMPVAVSSVDPKDKRMQGEILFRVRAGDEVDTDGIVHTIPVRKLRTLETAANYASTDSNQAEEQVLFPTDIHTDRGGISVVVSPSVIAGIEGAFRYLKNYAYNCWEQILTKGTMAAHYNALSDYMAADFKWDESRTLPKKTLEAAANFQAPNGGMAFYIPMDQYADPYLSAYTALAFNWLRKAGYTVPQQIESKLHGYLLELLRRDIAPTFYSAGMSSTIRAVALAALAEHGKIKLEDLERYKSHLPQMSLFGKAHYLQALHALNGNGTAVREVVQLILAHANQTGGKFIFNEELDDSYSRILASPLRENCTILSALVALAKRADTRELVQDVPTKLMRTIAQARKNRDHWENTQENMFCMQALMDYSRSYETAKPNMSVQVAIDQEIFGKATFKNLQDKPKTFERAIRASDLGRKGSVAVTRQGSGRVYYATRLQYADLNSLEAEANAGIEIHREYSVMRDDEWKLLTNPYRISRGELVRVDIFLSLPAARHFVVVDDPVPGGLEPVNRELATASLVDAASGDYRAAGGSLWFKFNDWSEYAVSRWSFYHQELRHDAVRFYSDFLPAGNYHLSYTAQAIAEGNFYARPVHAVEMYDSDVFGRGAGGKLEVLAQP